jgi:hypothetical protein
VRIGNKYDVYWDIFRDYLNTGRVPVQENYILRAQAGRVLIATKLLADSGGRISISEFQVKTELRLHSLYNLIREMRLLGLVKVEKEHLILKVELQHEAKAFEDDMRSFLRERLKRNRLVWQISEQLVVRDSLSLDEIAAQLKMSNPYISATDVTWREYARIMAHWMDFADLATLDQRGNKLSSFEAGSGVRQRGLELTKRRTSSLDFPPIQYKPIERAAIRIVEALKARESIDWSGFKKSTISKALNSLEELGFITLMRKNSAINVNSELLIFVNKPDLRHEIFAQRALRMKSFATFIDILNENGRKLSHLELGHALRTALNADWRDGTAQINAKIMLDWARHIKLAPDVYASLRGKRNDEGEDDPQTSLFEEN